MQKHIYCLYHLLFVIYIVFIINLAVNIAFPIIFIFAYIYILRFVHRSSRELSHCMISGNKNFKRLSKIILFILISQTFCFGPYQFMLIVVYIRTKFLMPLVYRFFMLRNNSSFINGAILLLSEKRKTKTKIKRETQMISLKKLRKILKGEQE